MTSSPSPTLPVLVFKVRKKGEPLEVLQAEHNFYSFVRTNESCKELQHREEREEAWDIHSEVPLVYGCYRILNVPKQTARYIDKDKVVCVENGGGTEGKGKGYYAIEAMVYTCGPTYHKHLYDVAYVKDTAALKEASAKSLHDLFWLARKGLVLPEVRKFTTRTS